MSTALVVTRDEPYGKSKFEVIQAYHDFLKCNKVDQKKHEETIQQDLYDIAHLCPFVTYKIEKRSAISAMNFRDARFISRIQAKEADNGRSV